MSYYCGIDLHSINHVVCVSDEEDKQWVTPYVFLPTIFLKRWSLEKYDTSEGAYRAFVLPFDRPCRIGRNKGVSSNEYQGTTEANQNHQVVQRLDFKLHPH